MFAMVVKKYACAVVYTHMLTPLTAGQHVLWLMPAGPVVMGSISHPGRLGTLTRTFRLTQSTLGKVSLESEEGCHKITHRVPIDL